MDVAPEDLVTAAEDAYNDLDIDRVLRLFRPDAVFYMNGKLKAKGTDELREFHERLFAAVTDYRLRKTLRAASGDVVAVEFEETWFSASDGIPMEAFGGEFWTIDGDRLAEWHLYWRSYPRSDGVT